MEQTIEAIPNPSFQSSSASSTTSSSTQCDCDLGLVRQSLNAAMREHKRARLYVQPIAWTFQHLQILRVQFNLDCRPDICEHNRGNGGVSYEPEILRAATHLGWANADVQQDALSEILMHYKLKRDEKRRKRSVTYPEQGDAWDFVFCSWRRLTSTQRYRYDRLKMYFGGYDAGRALTDGVFTAESGLGRLVCINIETIQLTRNEYIFKRNPMCLKGCNFSGVNEPVARLKNKKLKRLQPRLEAEDPYIVGLLIAMAQEQRQERMKDDVASNERKVAEKVYVMTFPLIPAQVAYFYKATIPHAFLDKFDKPNEPIACGGFAVSYAPVPLAVPEETLNCLVQVFCRSQLLHCPFAN